MKTIEDILTKIDEESSVRKMVSQKDYEYGMRDCNAGIYDKLYRYNRRDNGSAYDAGWQFQNKTTQNEKVQFLPGE